MMGRLQEDGWDNIHNTTTVQIRLRRVCMWNLSKPKKVYRAVFATMNLADIRGMSIIFLFFL
jgi:hypothetical protein